MREGHLEVDASHPQGNRDVFLLIGGDCMSLCSTVTITEQLNRNNALTDYFLLFQVISCGHPGVPANAILTGDLFTYGAMVHYSCRGSRSLVGNSSRTCQEDSHWSGALPHCTGELARAGHPSCKTRTGGPVSKVVTNPVQARTPLDTPPASWASSL